MKLFIHRSILFTIGDQNIVPLVLTIRHNSIKGNEFLMMDNDSIMNCVPENDFLQRVTPH